MQASSCSQRPTTPTCGGGQGWITIVIMCLDRLYSENKSQRVIPLDATGGSTQRLKQIVPRAPPPQARPAAPLQSCVAESIEGASSYPGLERAAGAMLTEGCTPQGRKKYGVALACVPRGRHMAIDINSSSTYT